MNVIEQGLKKADQRGRKIGKKVRGEKMIQKMVVHGRLIKRREVDRTTEGLLTRTRGSRYATVDMPKYNQKSVTTSGFWFNQKNP